MLDQIPSILTNSVQILAMVAGLTEVAKDFLPSKYSKITALVLGIVISLLVNGLSVTALIVGIILGLTTSGLYDVVQRTATKTVIDSSAPTDNV